MTQERITAAAVAIGVAILIWLIAKIIKARVGDKWKELVSQLMPVLVFAVLVFGALTVIDPGQASALTDSVPSAVVSITIGVLLVVIAQALGKIAGLLVETALRRVSPALASRGRLIVSSMILGIGVVIALQQVGISTNIILILVAALAFGFTLTMALSIGLGSVPIARHVAAGRHVHNRYRPGDRIRVGDIDGTIAEIGLSTTRIEVSEGRSVDIPNGEFIAGVVDVRSDG